MYKLDSRIKKVVQILWIDEDFQRGAEAKQLLEQMVEEGNADAYYFLARCYAGPQFVNTGFDFPDDENKCFEYLDLSIKNGSALGMFAGRRFGGYKPPNGTFVHEPYHSLKEIWEEVCHIADSGEFFTKYLVANAYYYGDVAKLLEMDFSHTPPQLITQQFRQWAETAIMMYEELLRANMLMGLGNYIDIITSGDYGVPKNEKRAKELRQLGADKGNPYYMVTVGEEIEKQQPEKAETYYKRALEHNYVEANFYLGRLYSLGGNGHRNLMKSRELLEKCLEAGKKTVGCNNYLGELYFYGGDGIDADYNKAFQHLLAAYKEDNHWGYAMLGTCYLKGLGTSVDYEKARTEFSRFNPNALAALGLGEIYANGLGVPVDIKKAMTYWDMYPNYPEIIEVKKNFKKTLFGWKRV